MNALTVEKIRLVKLLEKWSRRKARAEQRIKPVLSFVHESFYSLVADEV